MARKIIIFGGSFNPPTLAHEAIVRRCLELPGFDQVWLMPSGERSDKRIGTGAKHRLGMLNAVKKQSFGNNPRLVVTDFELSLPLPTQTYQTVLALQKAYPSNQFWFVFGPDAYRSMPTWENGSRLAAMLNIALVVGDQPAPHAPEAIKLDLPKKFADISSTTARQAAKAHKPLNHLLSPAVEAYVAKHKLYN